MRHIVLTGLSGCGKTTLGGLAAEKTGMPFVDLDRVVTVLAGMSIREIFELRGEEFFRDAESKETLEALSSPTPTVIATGGGVVLRQENVETMRKEGLVVFIDRPVELIARDILNEGSRPLVTGAEKLYELARERRELYLSASDAILPNSGSIGEALSKLVELIGAEARPRGYAVIGDPIGHSLSPVIHEAVFGDLGVDAPCAAARVPRGKLAGYAERARGSEMLGFNVTIPHKSAIIPLLDEVDEEAGLCGAVNTVVVREGRLHGHNTDMGGLLESLRRRGREWRGRSVVILGAGGAARGVALKAAMEGAARITVLSRRAERAEEIASGVGRAVSCEIGFGAMSRETMREAARGADILVNATPLGMSGTGEDFPSLDFLRELPKGSFVSDLVYSPPLTSLLRRARELGIEGQNGLDMLICQAILADELFLGRRLDRNALHEIAYKTVKERLTK
ncbi:MAG: shikimate dehydrogenase [Synergistaceae bacterium]|jgi:shikimate dehydrogenase|nr:shikimate dehydrogenase [Synergistaceae bacterium]